MTNRYHFDDKIHCHYLDGKALVGTSSVSGVLSKPLTWWASGKAVEVLGWTNKNLEPNIDKRIETCTPMLEKVKTMPPKVYLALLDKAYANHSVYLQDTATAGTDLHATLEEWVKSVIEGKEITPCEQIMPFVEWCRKFVKRFLWSELYTYSEQLWLGGITDCGVEMHNGDIGIIDFKSAKEAYYEHFLQCAGYIIELEESGGYTANGDKVFTLDKPIEFMAICPFGAKDIIPRTNHNIKDFKESFKSCLQIYKHKKEYGE